jgi:hypothetical protein
MSRYNFTSLRQAADEIERVGRSRRITVGDSIAPDDIADETLSGDDDISGDFFWKYKEVHLIGIYAYHSVDRELLLSAQGLRAMAGTAEDADNKSADNIFHRFAKYADTGGGTDLV